MDKWVTWTPASCWAPVNSVESDLRFKGWMVVFPLLYDLLNSLVDNFTEFTYSWVCIIYRMFKNNESTTQKIAILENENNHHLDIEHHQSITAYWLLMQDHLLFSTPSNYLYYNLKCIQLFNPWLFELMMNEIHIWIFSAGNAVYR